ncbi:hypothetical protein [Enterobacter hormaechei]|nr:hypothetical protein [Enterobacter hormaechei]
MSKKNDGGYAFPMEATDATAWRDCNQGMTLRDYFAAKAMQSIVSSPKEMESLIDTLGAKTAYAKVSETAY